MTGFVHLWAQQLLRLLALLFMLSMPISAVAEAVSNFKAIKLSMPEQAGAPMACVQVNYQVDGNHQHLEDFVRLESALQKTARVRTKHPVSVQVRDSELCVRELSHGRYYFLTLRAGLPLAHQQWLADDFTFRFTVADREPEVRFQTATYILPANQNAQVPVTAVNFGQAEIKVLRLSPEQVQARMDSGRLFAALDGYDLERLQEQSQLIGATSIDLTGPKNQHKTFNLDLSEVMQGQAPGAYVLAIKTGQSRWQEWPVQTLIYTDIGLASYQSADSLHVYARSYATATPKAGLSLELLARNHDVLARATTDGDGKVVFSGAILQGQYGHQPVQVRYLGEGGEYAVLNLTGQALDIADRPVGGAPPLGLLNAYMFAERGVYRLGEELVITGLVRNKHLQAVPDMPLTLKILRPDGDVAFTKQLLALQQGGFQQRLTIPAAGRTGQWRAELHMGAEAAPLGVMTFEVADYVPETIQVSLPEQVPLYINDGMEIPLQSDYLYGSPAQDLAVESSATIRQKRRLFEQYDKYVFGAAEAFKPDTFLLQETRTDSTGQATIKVPANLLQRHWQQQALAINMRVKVIEPSGRPATRTMTIPAVQFPSWVGIKAQDNYPVYDKQKPVLFHIANINDAQQPIAKAKVRYQLVEEEWDYHWYYRHKRWQYKVSKFDGNIIADGVVVTNDKGLASIDLGILDWGRYRLEVIDSNSGQRTQLAFRNGWWQADGSQSAMPDNVKLAPGKQALRVGESLPLKVQAPYAGQLHLMVANDRIVEERIVDLAKGETELYLEATAAWGQGVYFLASVYRPGAGHVGPARAIGISHIKVQRPELHAALSIKAPQQVRPNQPVTMQLATDLPEGSTVMLAAVDEGILQLTRYQSPDPAQWFLQKRRLGIELRDLYGHLIQHQQGEQLRLHFGGDGDAGAPTAPPMQNFVKPVALVSQLLTVDKHGEADINFTLPQFNGSLRLMAVAFDKQAMGAASQQMLVRNPVVVQPALPKFMAVDDRAEIGVSLHNLELPPSDIELQWETSAGLQLTNEQQLIRLAKGQRQDLTASLQALTAGPHDLRLRVLAKGQPPQVYTWPITVVLNRLLEKHYQQAYIAPGERQMLLSMVGDLSASSRRLDVLATAAPVVATKWLTQTLNDYPFGCLEQTTSKAWSHLLLNIRHQSPELAMRERYMEQAIAHLGTMQLRDGSFTLWAGGRYRQEWLSMYATELLMAADKRGHYVPELMLEQAKQYVSNYRGDNVAAKAYAYYLQAKLGVLDPGELRYLAATSVRGSYRPQVYVHLLLASDLMGQTALLPQLTESIKPNSSGGWYRTDYSSYLRDAAMATYAALTVANSTTEQKKKAYAEIQQLFTTAQEKRWLSTQEKAWLLRLADLMGEAEYLAGSLPISIDLQTMTLSQAAEHLRQQDSWSSFKNKSEQDMFLTINASGINKRLSAAQSHNGVVVNSYYYDLSSGEKIDLNVVKVGTEVLVRHKLEITNGTDVELSLEAPIPAGFELEIPRLSGIRPEVAVLAKTEPEFEEFRDDRYLAAWSLKHGYRDLNQGESTIAYVMRAVTPGEFIVPAVRVADMYRPQYQANTAEGRVVIEP
ncbi:MAG: MG2 domain-containing protein [Gammaproteobacteria bacterium]|nr:MG2 domain-containing protein [Gammaproteobacteria bacterium]